MGPLKVQESSLPVQKFNYFFIRQDPAYTRTHKELYISLRVFTLTERQTHLKYNLLNKGNTVRTAVTYFVNKQLTWVDAKFEYAMVYSLKKYPHSIGSLGIVCLCHTNNIETCYFSQLIFEFIFIQIKFHCLAPEHITFSVPNLHLPPCQKTGNMSHWPSSFLSYRF